MLGVRLQGVRGGRVQGAAGHGDAGLGKRCRSRQLQEDQQSNECVMPRAPPPPPKEPTGTREGPAERERSQNRDCDQQDNPGKAVSCVRTTQAGEALEEEGVVDEDR